MLNKSFDKPVLGKADGRRMNGKCLIPFVVSVSSPERDQLVQRFLNTETDDMDDMTGGQGQS